MHGYCISAGLMLAWCCDLICASDDAVFVDVVGARLGMCGLEYFAHPWELGPRKAKELLLTGDSIDANEAYRLGMVNKVFDRAALDEETLNLARRIAEVPSFAALLIKESVNQTQDAQGFYTALKACFSIHEANHAHWAEVTNGAAAIGTPEFGVSGERRPIPARRAHEQRAARLSAAGSRNAGEERLPVLLAGRTPAIEWAALHLRRAGFEPLPLDRGSDPPPAAALLADLDDEEWRGRDGEAARAAEAAGCPLVLLSSFGRGPGARRGSDLTVSAAAGLLHVTGTPSDEEQRPAVLSPQQADALAGSFAALWIGAQALAGGDLGRDGTGRSSSASRSRPRGRPSSGSTPASRRRDSASPCTSPRASSR